MPYQTTVGYLFVAAGSLVRIRPRYQAKRPSSGKLVNIMCDHGHDFQVEFCDAIKRHFFGSAAELVYTHRDDHFGIRIGLGAHPAQRGGYDWAVHLLIEPGSWWPKLVEVALSDWETIWYIPMDDCRCLIADETRNLMHVVGRLLLEEALQEKIAAPLSRTC